MTTKTAPKTNTNTAQNDGWTNLSSSLPPFAILDIGQSLQGRVESVDVVKQKLKGKKEAIERLYYRISLTEPCTALNGAKQEVTYERGQLVTLPGSGMVDRIFKAFALKAAGITVDDFDGETSEVPFNDHLKGKEVLVLRLDDQKMKKGAFAGKMVKAYDIKVRA